MDKKQTITTERKIGKITCLLYTSGKAVMAYPPTGSVQTECTRLPVMLRTKGRLLCQRTIGFVGLQKHINSGYAFAERQIAHNGKRGKGTRLSLIHI